MGIFIVVTIGIGFSSLLFVNDSIAKELYYLYEQLYVISAVTLSMYPIFSFKAICPQIGKNKLYLNVSNLPFSKKQLFWNGIKPWIIIFPSYLLVGALISSLLKERNMDFGLIYLFSILKPAVLIVSLAAFQLQMMSAIILIYAKRIKWYKVIVGIVLGNIILMTLCMVGIKIFNIDTFINLNWMFGILAIFILGGIILLSACWQDVENMNR